MSEWKKGDCALYEDDGGGNPWYALLIERDDVGPFWRTKAIRAPHHKDHKPGIVVIEMDRERCFRRHLSAEEQDVLLKALMIKGFLE